MASFPWSLSEIEAKTRVGALSPEQLLQASIEAIQTREPETLAWSCLALEFAQQTASSLAAELERGVPRSPLHGVPYAVKDIFDTAGIPTEWGSVTQRGRVPQHDCALVRKLNALGGVLLGKTHTTAFAYYDTAPTRNPRNLAHTPGGSSSGSAAAVAAGMAPLAIGSQTQGSVLRPASFCGIAGFKPSYGLLPLDGVMAFAPTLDHAGLFAATAQDLRLAWRALGFEIRAAPATTITVLDWPPMSRVEPGMADAFGSTVELLTSAGIRMEHAERPSFFDPLPATLRTVMAFEAVREHGSRYRVHGTRMGVRLAELLDEGQQIQPQTYESAFRVLRAARVSFAAWARRHRIIATPSAPGPAPPGLDSSGDPRCNAPFTALGAPAVSIPMPTPRDQLPMGLQLVASQGDDAFLLSTAETCEALLHARC